MDVFKTPGAISWSELMTADPAAAAAFYGELFGWTFDQMDMGSGPYRVIKVGADDAIGGIMAAPPGQSSIVSWRPSARNRMSNGSGGRRGLRRRGRRRHPLFLFGLLLLRRLLRCLGLRLQQQRLQRSVASELALEL